MASRATAEKWLRELTNLVTASGKEDEAVEWVEAWVRRRDDLRLDIDSGGNLLVTQKGQKRRAPVIAVAHMDHPAFVVTSVGDHIEFEFRGGVDEAYFLGARVRIPKIGGAHWLQVTAYDPKSQTGVMERGVARGQIEVGDIGMWVFPPPVTVEGMHLAPACDDLAGVAAALAALDRARGRTELRHYGVLLTRAEEVGLVGALHAAITGSVPHDARMISIETSRELPEAKVGEGPIVRTGDRATVFDRDLTNRITDAARRAGLKHQRKLMDGGGCEATAFGGLGYQAAGLCVALRNWHNRGNLDLVEAGRGRAIALPEEISLDDFHGLVDLILIAAEAADATETLGPRLRKLYDEQKGVLGL